MSPEQWLSMIAETLLKAPHFVEAMRRILAGHPSAKRVRDILDGPGESEKLAEELGTPRP